MNKKTTLKSIRIKGGQNCYEKEISLIIFSDSQIYIKVC